MGEDAAQGVTGETIWLDGEWLDWDQAQIHVLTHSLHYGLGVFEGIRCYQTTDGRSAVFRLDEHIRRLYDSARINLMEIPYPAEIVSEVTLESLRRNGLSEGYIRPLVFIGDGAMGLHPGENAIRVAVISWAWRIKSVVMPPRSMVMLSAAASLTSSIHSVISMRPSVGFQLPFMVMPPESVG